MKDSDGSELGKMHYKNLLNAQKSMDYGISPVVIDNANIKPYEAKKYVEYGLKKGYDVIIKDIGTNSLDAETLAGRNSHGVPLEKIEKMIQTYKSIGELTVDKIMEAKTNDKKFIWSSVKLDEKSRGTLLSRIGYLTPLDWKVIAEHMTLSFGKTLKSLGKEDLVGQTLNLKVIAYGFTDMAFAVMVEGFKDVIVDKTPHITIAINEKEGAKPVMSNDITNWVYFKDKDLSHINLKGIVVEIIK